MSEDVSYWIEKCKELKRENAELREALQQLLTRYTEVVDWNPESELEVKDARTALKAKP